MKVIEPRHVIQPTPSTCVHACLAMVTDESVDDLIERFGDRGLSWHEEYTVLVENKIFPSFVPSQSANCFPTRGTYFVTVPSLNLPGSTHRIVIHAGPDGFRVLDPNQGREAVAAYAEDNMDISYGEVVYLDTVALRKMRDVA